MSMERQEAIKTLVKAGKASEVKEFLDSKAKSAQTQYRQIQDDPDLTDDAKRARVAKCYMSVIEGVNDELSRKASLVFHNDKDDASSVFGIKGLDGDPASLAISRRDAADRIAACSNAKEVRELLRRATRSGDEVLARAAVEWAVETQSAETANEYLKSRPQHEAALQRLWDGAKAESGSGSLQMAMAVGGLRPPGMFSMSDASINAVAHAS